MAVGEGGEPPEVPGVLIALEEETGVGGLDLTVWLGGLGFGLGGGGVGLGGLRVGLGVRTGLAVRAGGGGGWGTGGGGVAGGGRAGEGVEVGGGGGGGTSKGGGGLNSKLLLTELNSCGEGPLAGAPMGKGITLIGGISTVMQMSLIHIPR